MITNILLIAAIATAGFGWLHWKDWHGTLTQQLQGKVNCSDRTQSPPPGCPRRDT